MSNTPSSPDFKTTLSNLENFLDLYLVKKAPGLPSNVKEFIVKYSPYLALIMILFSLPAMLVALGLGALVSPFIYLGSVRSGFSFSLTSLILLATLVLEAIALPGLFSKKFSSWKLVYYAVLVGAVHSLFTLNIGNLIIGTALSLYVLFQIRSYYQ